MMPCSRRWSLCRQLRHWPLRQPWRGACGLQGQVGARGTVQSGRGKGKGGRRQGGEFCAQQQGCGWYEGVTATGGWRHRVPRGQVTVLREAAAGGGRSLGLALRPLLPSIQAGKPRHPLTLDDLGVGGDQAGEEHQAGEQHGGPHGCWGRQGGGKGEGGGAWARGPNGGVCFVRDDRQNECIYFFSLGPVITQSARLHAGSSLPVPLLVPSKVFEVAIHMQTWLKEWHLKAALTCWGSRSSCQWLQQS